MNETAGTLPVPEVAPRGRAPVGARREEKVVAFKVNGSAAAIGQVNM
jgi:hypothetical protein